MIVIEILFYIIFKRFIIYFVILINDLPLYKTKNYILNNRKMCIVIVC